MENDLISRSALLNQRPEYLNPDHVDIEKALFAKGWNACNSEYYSLITASRAVEVEPVRHGWWKQYKNDSGFCWPLDICCSECGSQYTFCKNPNYCPNCGAKMDAEVEG